MQEITVTWDSFHLNYRCGLVALEMAAQRFNPALIPTQIFEAAKLRRYTRSGEMFSAANMAELAGSLLECHARLINTTEELNALMELFSCVLEGGLALVP